MSVFPSLSLSPLLPPSSLQKKNSTGKTISPSLSLLIPCRHETSLTPLLTTTSYFDSLSLVKESVLPECRVDSSPHYQSWHVS